MMSVSLCNNDKNRNIDCKFRSSVFSVVKYVYNSPLVFYCKVQSDNPR